MEVKEQSSEESLCYSKACLRVGLLSDIPLTFGAFLGLVSLATHCNSRDLVECCYLLHSYAIHERFDEQWLRTSCWDLAATLVLWLVAVSERVRGAGMVQAAQDNNMDVFSVLHIATFAFSSLILVTLAFCMLYVCRALMGSVDAFCFVTLGEQSLLEAVPRWNKVQAILRKGSGSIQTCIFILSLTVLFTFLLGAVDVYQSSQQKSGYVSTLIPGALLVVVVSRIFFKAAGVTDKCNRVPSLINSCSFGDDSDGIDEKRQYVVTYVLNSAAGFHVKEIRLTSDMTLKFVYLCAVGIFALSTQILTDL